MDVIVKADIIVSLVVFFTFTGVSGDVCSDEFDKTTRDDVVNVCTKSSTSTSLGAVHFDTKSVPLLEISRCTCTLVFEDNRKNTVDVKIRGNIGPGNTLNITGLGLPFLSEINSTLNTITITTEDKENYLVFVINKNDDYLKACLRISQNGDSNSRFRVSCFPRDINPSDLPPPNSPVVNPSDLPPPNSPVATSNENSESRGVGVAVGGSIGGAAVLILGVGMAIIIIRKRRNTSTPNSEEYEVTENAMYGAARTIQQAAEYETIDTKLTGKGSSLYSDKSSGDTNTALRGKLDTPENEYNHLNDVSPVFFTGNVYSSTGNTYSSTGSNQLDEHQVGSGNVYDKLSDQTHGQKNIHKTDNVYD